MGKSWGEAWAQVYGLAGMICERRIAELQGGGVAFPEEIVSRL
jgi:hypothetical protein